MSTEIPDFTERPTTTAEDMRRLITGAYKAYETSDRDAIEEFTAEDFSFTSPHDHAVDRETYFQRCWRNHETMATMKVERIFIEGDGAYVAYAGTNAQGRSFHDTEYLTFRGSQIVSVEVYFGAEHRQGASLPAGLRHPNRSNSADKSDN